MGRRTVFEIISTELGRAVAAARHYETLRCGRASADIARADIPQRIFEAFYAHRSDTDFAPPDISGRDPIDIDLRLRAWRAATIEALMSSAVRGAPTAASRFFAEVLRSAFVRNPRTRRGTGRKNHVHADT